MTLLASRLRLGDVHDLEAICRSILNRELHRMRDGAYLSVDDYEDALAHLFEHAIRLHRSFKPAQNSSFAGYLAAHLPLRVVDYYRSRFGRSGAYRPPDGSCSLQELDPRDATTVLRDPDEFEADQEVTDRLDRLSPESKRLAEAKLEGRARAEVQRDVGITSKAAAAQERRLRVEVVWVFELDRGLLDEAAEPLTSEGEVDAA